MTKSMLRVLGKWLLSADLYRDKSVYWTQRIFRGEYIKVATKEGKSYTDHTNVYIYNSRTVGNKTISHTNLYARRVKQAVTTCLENFVTESQFETKFVPGRQSCKLKFKGSRFNTS